MVKKDCFGILEKVFPMGQEGLLEVPSGCFECDEKKECLKSALESRDGLAFRDEILSRTPVDGLAGRLRRWSEKKFLDRLIKQKGENR